MNYKEHLTWGVVSLVGLTIIVLVAYFMDYLQFISVYGRSYGIYIDLSLAWIFGLYASILPDVDIGTSKAFAITYLVLILIIIYFLLIVILILPVIICLVIMISILFLKHRGITHCWYSALIVGLGFYLLFDFNIIISSYVIIGYLTHLVCDR